MKKITALLLAACMLLLFTACGGGKEVKIDELSAELVASGAFTMDMGQYAMNAALAGPTYGFDEADVTESVFYFNNATAEEIFLAKAADKDAAAKLEGLCKTRVESQKAALEMYAPDAIPRLDNAIVVTADNYVIFVVANDAAAARTIVDKYMK